MISRNALLLATVLSAAACTTDDVAPPAGSTSVQTISLLGEPLRSPELDDETSARLADDLAVAYAELAANPGDELATIWVGRRLAYLGRYREAVSTFTAGLERHPASHRLLRHRGHRWITLREFDRAVADLSRAAQLAADLPDEVEPDGAPNAAGIPISSTWSNIQYHLGLAQFLRGEDEAALEAFAASTDTPLSNPDKIVSAAHWRWQALQRLGRADEARELIASIPAGLQVIENQAYRDLVELYRSGPPRDDVELAEIGDDPSAAAYAYGRAGWLDAHGHDEAADDLRRRILAETPWPAFGHIAAETDLASSR